MRISKLFAVAALTLGVAVAGCRADVEDTGEPPEVNVEPGQAPDIDIEPVDSLDVDVGTDTQRVLTPDVDVNNP